MRAQEVYKARTVAQMPVEVRASAMKSASPPPAVADDALETTVAWWQCF